MVPPRSRRQVVLASGLDSSQTHEVRLFKSSEAQWAEDEAEPNYVTVRAIIATGPTAPSLLPPTQLPNRRLEFVGDSITAGYDALISTCSPGYFQG